MFIRVDLETDPPAVTLEEPEDCRRFHVEAKGGDGGASARLGPALEEAGAGRVLPGGDAMIDVAAVRRMAEGRVPGDWDDQFAAMLKYAESKGWLDETGTAIQAHVEARSGS